MQILKITRSTLHFASRHILTILLLSFIALLVAGSIRRTIESSRIKGSIVKGFHATSYDGSTIGEEILRGQVVVVNFFATWCTVCKAEQPGFNFEYLRYAKRNVLFVGISLNDPVGKLKAYVQAWHIPYSIAKMNERIAHIFGHVTSVPTTFIVNRNGEIVSELKGFTSPIRLEYEISRLIR